MSGPAKRRFLGILLALTAAIVMADLAGNPVVEAIRTASGAVVGPVQRALSGTVPGEVARLEAENARLRVRVDLQASELRAREATAELLASGQLPDQPVVVGRVVASELSPLGGRAITVDVGSRDGVEVDSTVVASAGLVGRVVAVSPWTSDVQVLGASQSVVAVRVGPDGLVGSVAPLAPLAEGVPRPRGLSGGTVQLALTMIEPSAPRPGDVVTTLGSVGGRPYAPGVTVGRVVSVDHAPGRGTVTGRVVPAVERDSIDVVAVLVQGQRQTARAVLEGGPP